MFIAIPSFTLLYQIDEVTDIGMTIKVVGNQWYWQYEYSTVLDKIEFDQRMQNTRNVFRYLLCDTAICIPVDVNIRFLITSLDVIHSWAIPAAGIKVDACPGRLNEVFLRMNRQAILFGQCSELCGINHAFMPIMLEAICLEDFERFLFNFSTNNINYEDYCVSCNLKK